MKSTHLLMFVFSFFFMSCALLKRAPKKLKIEGTITINHPYCGGAKPSPEMALGNTIPYANKTFIVKKQMNNDPELETVATFKTDSKGRFKVKLPEGNYSVILSDKVLSFEDFVKKYKQADSDLVAYVGDKKAKENYEKVDFTMDVTHSKSVDYTFKAACFTGDNPVMKYIGPKPQ